MKIGQIVQTRSILRSENILKSNMVLLSGIKSAQNSEESLNHKVSVGANGQYNVSFGSKIVTDAARSICPIFDQYLYDSRNTIDFIKDTPMTPSGAFKFLCHATSDERTANRLVRDLSSDPRKGEEIRSAIIEQLGVAGSGEQLFNIWLHDEAGGYNKAYFQYYDNEIWNKASNLETLIKHSPNIAPWALMNKASALNTEMTVGEIPKDFVNLQTYRDLVGRIWSTNFYDGDNRSYDVNQEESKGDTLILAAKNNEFRKRHAKVISFNINGQEFDVSPLTDSCSSKLIYSVVPKKNESQQYILKIDPYQTWDENGFNSRFNENQAIRPDMPYLNAMVDFYLKYNNSPNATDIEFYDYKTKSVLYQASTGIEPEIPEEYSDNLFLFINYDKIADVKKLGIELSDTHSGNFRIGKDGNYKLIDSGHVKYSNIFRPSVIGKHIILGNLCGRELCK